MFRPLPRSACLSAVVLLTAVLCTRFSDGEPPLPTDIDGAVERDDGLRALSEAHRDQAGGATKVEQGGVGASLKDIKAVGIEVNYRSANLLSHADLTGAQLRKAKLSGGVKAFYETKFDSADLTEARLTGKAAFQAASFTHAKLGNAMLDGGGSGFQKARFDDSTLAGAQLVGGGSSFQLASFARANLTGAVLKGEGPALQLVNLDGANCTDLQVICSSARSAFQRASLNKTRFAGANLSSLAKESLDSCVFNPGTPPTYDDDTHFPDGFDPVKQGWRLLSSN